MKVAVDDLVDLRQGVRIEIVTRPRYWDELGKAIGETILGNTIAFDEYAMIKGASLNGQQLYRTWTWGAGDTE